MALTQGKWVAPTNIAWYSTDGSGSYSTIYGALVLEAQHFRYPWQIVFDSNYSTFQVQYRRRRRYLPANVPADSMPGAEIYEDWSDWISDVDIDTISASNTERLTATAYDVVWNGDFFTFNEDYKSEGFDRIEYQVRIRAINQSDATCSAWTTQTMIVTWKPSVYAASAYRDGNDLMLTLGTDWERGLNSVIIGSRGTQSWTTTTFSKWQSQPLKIPAGDAGSGEALTTFRLNGNYIRWKYIDGAEKGKGVGVLVTGYFDEFPIGNNFLKFELTSRKSTKVGVPQYKFTDNIKLEVNAANTASTGGDYDNIYVAYTWTDADGNIERTVNVDGEYTTSGEHYSKAWVFDLEGLPYDVDVVVRIAGAISGYYADTTFNYNASSNGRCTWIGEDGTTASLVLRLNEPITIKRQFSPEQETVKLAGREREVSRYGTGGSMTLDLEGAILLNTLEPKNTDVGASDHAPFFQALTANAQDFVFTAPRGVRARVQINSVSFETHRDYETVQISMSEVE